MNGQTIPLPPMAEHYLRGRIRDDPEHIRVQEPVVNDSSAMHLVVSPGLKIEETKSFYTFHI